MKHLQTIVIFAALAASAGHAVAADAPKMSAEGIVLSTSSDQGDRNAILVMLILLAALALAGGNSAPGPSDARLKRDIRAIGRTSGGYTLYQFRYRGLSGVYQGVMAQEVAQKNPEAVLRLPGGFMAVDYARLGLEMRQVA